MRITARLLCALSFVLAACGDESAPLTRAADSVDTIDYRIKDSPLAITEVARVASTMLDLTPKNQLRAMVILPDDGIAMLQHGELSITFFGPNGEQNGSFGRSGGAPGEFRSLFAIGLMGDTLWAGDTELDRATLIGPGRQLIRTIKLPKVEGENDPNSDVSMKVLLGLDRDAFLGIFPVGEQLFRANFKGDLINPLPRNAEGRNYQVRIGNSYRFVNLFSAGAKLDVSADGKLIAIVVPIMEGDNAPAVAVNVIRSTGDTAFVRVIKFEGVKIPSSAVDSAIAHRTKRQPSEYAAAYRQQAYVPPYYPPVQDVLVGQDGRLWLKLHSTGEKQGYIVLDPAGDLAGTVVFPPRTTVRAATGNVVWALQLNEFDVADIVKFQIAAL